MKSEIKLEIVTRMKENISSVPEEYVGKPEDCPKDEICSSEDIEKSIHDAIPRLLDDERVKEAIQDIINEGGWIEDIDSYDFPEDYCDFTLKVLK